MYNAPENHQDWMPSLSDEISLLPHQWDQIIWTMLVLCSYKVCTKGTKGTLGVVMIY